MTDRGPDRQGRHGGYQRHRTEREGHRVEGHPARRGNGDPRLTHRGQRRRRHRGQDRADGARRPDQRRAGQGDRDELAGPQAHRGQGRMIGPLGGRLPGDRLPDHGQGGQRGQAGQHVPADDLGPDRVLDRARGRVQVVGAVHVQRPEPAVQAGQVRGTVGESGVVGVLQRRALIHRRGELRRGVQVVVHRRPGRELALGGDDAHHAQRRAQDRGRIGRAPAQLGRAGQLGPDHRADPHPVVLGEREGRQYLTRIGWVGHPPGEQHHQPGQLPRRYLIDQGVLEIDRFPAGRAAQGDGESRWYWRHRHGVRQPGQLRQRPSRCRR